jgi:HEXXH motif-containing protein
MTSRDVPADLWRDLCFARQGEAAVTPRDYAFERDFDSGLAWPDLPFDTASPASRYPPAARSDIEHVMRAAADLAGRRAPATLAFVNRHARRLVIRRSDTIDGASSSSNRMLVGSCLFTNLHLAQDRVHVCVEGLLHESIHQYLYRTEIDHGNFCDLDDTRTFRSPWSGNRIPLHSLVHAAFVWFGLLNLWSILGRTVESPAEVALMGERVSSVRFGFAFVRRMMESPAFPRNAVDPRIAELIGRFAETAREAPSGESRDSLRDWLQRSERGGWVDELASRL